MQMCWVNARFFVCPSMKKLLTLLLAVCIASIAFATNSDKISDIGVLREVADSLHSIGRTDSAAVVGERAIKLAEQLGDPVQLVGTHSAQGVFLRSLGDINGALASYNKALEIVTSGQFREAPGQEAIEEIASLYINLAVLNLDMQHKDEAAKNAVLAGDWISKSNDPDLKSMIYGVAGSVLTGCGELQKALTYQGKAYQNAVKANDTEAAFRASAYTMLIADRLGDKSQAQRWRDKCLELLSDINSITAKLVYYQAECSICLKNDNPKEAITYFEKILNLEGIDQMPFIQFDCYNNMHIAYAGLGDYKNAYSTLLKGNELRDSIWEREKTESLRDLMVKYETKEAELALAQSEAKRNSTIMWLIAAMAVIVVIVASFVIYAGIQRRCRMKREMEFADLRADTERQLTRQYIEGLETERKRMSRELHGGVCNDLLAIQMNMRNGLDSESTENLIESCRDSVRRISHELMPPEFSFATIDEVMRYYVGKQQESTLSIRYHSESNGSSWETVPDHVSLEIYRILQEAIGNAIKHSGGDTIKVEMILTENTLTATVVDNGLFRTAGGRGLGLKSMKRRANAIDADLSIDSAGSGGTTVVITVKI